MKTYKIVGHTNKWIAGTDIQFNGKQAITLVENLTYDQAIAKLNEFLLKDYKFASEINSEEDYVHKYFEHLIQEAAINAHISEDEYFSKTKKRWTIYANLKSDHFRKYVGPGIYNDGSFLKGFNDENYDYDSKYFGILEELEGF